MKPRKAVFGMLLLTSVTAVAGNTKVTIQCEGPVAPNGPLQVTATFTNDDCSQYATVSQVMVGLAGNSAGSLNLVGPFNKVFAKRVAIPRASCDSGFTPGVARRQITVTNSVPAEFAGTMAFVFAEGLNANGGTKFGSQCFVEISP